MSSLLPAVLPRQRLMATGSLLLIAAVWGATFFMIKEVTADYSITAFLVLRWLIAAVALLPFCWQLRRGPTASELKWGGLAGLFFALGYVLQIMALRLSDSGRVGFITGLYVVMVPMLALLTLRYPIKRRVLISIALALGGMILLSYAPGSTLAGDVMAFLSALSFAAQILVVEKFPRGMDWRFVSVVQALCVAGLNLLLMPWLALAVACESAVCNLLAPFADPLPTSLPFAMLLVALFSGLVASALGLVLQIVAQRVLPPDDAALIYAAEAPLAAIFGVAFRGEFLTSGALVGCGLIFASMLTVTLSGRQEQPAPSG